MLPLVPLLFLAYAALYAFAAAIPRNAIELDVRDAISARAPIPAIAAEPVASRSQRKKRAAESEANSTPVVGKLSMDGRAPLVPGVLSLTTGEGKGFYHSCVAGAC
ncbi:hypothetical protein K461DRAFT_146333 [Myriangium duriaei CBS 260.36]|uniref:Uncharacterized protein n=1 Tax=Myriangium duriaei CBS 260.36 TaxID=1168546 RepID=A0A9P4MM57_9PEZI|nr:hypothetical protein K461DRAFT_146333 [Myriangium duriaei CBS 260.36]